MSRKKNRAMVISLMRLRATFLALGAILLGGLCALSWFVQQRLEEARRDREEMVASRVFDEMEREISAFLEGESQRPHYDNLQETNPETWAPFVVGYFSGAGEDPARAPRIVAAEGTTSENRRRTQWAIDQARPSFATNLASSEGSESVVETPASLEERRAQSQGASLDPEAQQVFQQEVQDSPQKSKASGSSIIQQLNRASERRKSKRSAPAETGPRDAFSDYEAGF